MGTSKSRNQSRIYVHTWTLLLVSQHCDYGTSGEVHSSGYHINTANFQINVKKSLHLRLSSKIVFQCNTKLNKLFIPKRPQFLRTSGAVFSFSREIIAKRVEVVNAESRSEAWEPLLSPSRFLPLLSDLTLALPGQILHQTSLQEQAPQEQLLPNKHCSSTLFIKSNSRNWTRSRHVWPWNGFEKRHLFHFTILLK